MAELEMELSLGQADELLDVETSVASGRTKTPAKSVEEDEVGDEIDELRKKIEKEHSGV
jgi:hypothetical protein